MTKKVSQRSKKQNGKPLKKTYCSRVKKTCNSATSPLSHLEHGQLGVEAVLAGVERDRLEVDLLVPELHPHGGGHAQQDVLALLQVLPHGRALSRPLGK